MKWMVESEGKEFDDDVELGQLGDDVNKPWRTDRTQISRPTRCLAWLS